MELKKNKLKIAFQTQQLDIRGSCVAMYDYALYNEKLLKNTSIIVTDYRRKSLCDTIAILKFSKRFPVYFYKDKEDLYEYLKKQKVDIVYSIKYGKKDEVNFQDIKTVVHCVFDLSEPHGDVYAGVSETLAKKYKWPLFVPHMVGLQPSIRKENLRKTFKNT